MMETMKKTQSSKQYRYNEVEALKSRKDGHYDESLVVAFSFRNQGYLQIMLTIDAYLVIDGMVLI